MFYMMYQRVLQYSSQLIWVCISAFQLISSSVISARLFHFSGPIVLHEEAHTNKLNMPTVKDSRQNLKSILKKYTSKKQNPLLVLIVHESASNYSNGDAYLFNGYLWRNYHATSVRYCLLSDILENGRYQNVCNLQYVYTEINVVILF